MTWVRRLRDRLRPYLLGAASLFDLSGSLTYREARRALPPADDWKAVGDHFAEAGRLLREAMNDAGIRDGESRENGSQLWAGHQQAASLTRWHGA